MVDQNTSLVLGALYVREAYPPKAVDDSTIGMAPGVRWINTLTNDEYVCISALPGQAVWGLMTIGDEIPAVTSVNTRTGDVTILASDLPTFVASGASHAVGGVPDPGASAGTTRFLREDATWYTPMLTARKGSDTSRLHGAAASADPDLTFALAASVTFSFQFLLYITQTVAQADFGYGVTVPSGCSVFYTADFVQVGTAVDVNASSITGSNVTQALDFSAAWVATIRGVVKNSTTPGTVALNWNAPTGSTGSTVLKAGSGLIAHRLA